MSSTCLANAFIAIVKCVSPLGGKHVHQVKPPELVFAHHSGDLAVVEDVELADIGDSTSYSVWSEACAHISSARVRFHSVLFERRASEELVNDISCCHSKSGATVTVDDIVVNPTNLTHLPQWHV
ncbi:hypothetical protein B0H66DRAFT_536059 [Apodospora peruviana]|uniref:Uncharacterized protein n=1 Tax=Apodospora peruviana TaxID=516989 RepID=A0AAE0HZ44_9PEZI|nr:hypothetical protein B0H66DRAFT_536059 [Apodospora peruviana]